jgi:hypothetical protein
VGRGGTSRGLDAGLPDFGCLGAPKFWMPKASRVLEEWLGIWGGVGRAVARFAVLGLCRFVFPYMRSSVFLSLRLLEMRERCR